MSIPWSVGSERDRGSTDGRPAGAHRRAAMAVPVESKCAARGQRGPRWRPIGGKPGRPSGPIAAAGHPRPVRPGPAQVGLEEDGLDEVGPAQVGVAEVGPDRGSRPGDWPAEVGAGAGRRRADGPPASRSRPARPPADRPRAGCSPRARPVPSGPSGGSPAKRCAPRRSTSTRWAPGGPRRPRSAPRRSICDESGATEPSPAQSPGPPARRPPARPRRSPLARRDPLDKLIRVHLAIHLSPAPGRLDPGRPSGGVGRPEESLLDEAPHRLRPAGRTYSGSGRGGQATCASTSERGSRPRQSVSRWKTTGRIPLRISGRSSRTQSAPSTVQPESPGRSRCDSRSWDGIGAERQQRRAASVEPIDQVVRGEVRPGTPRRWDRSGRDRCRLRAQLRPSVPRRRLMTPKSIASIPCRS